MNPGRLDRQIILLAPQAVQRADGESVSAFVQYAADVPAEQINPGTRQLTQAGIADTIQRNLFRLRYRSDVRAGHRVIFEGTTYKVTGWNEDPSQPRRAYILVSCEEVTPAPTSVIAP